MNDKTLTWLVANDAPEYVLNVEIDTGKQLEELKQKGMEILKNNLLEFFNKYPTVESFTWYQYTDYFNDGEPCYFSVHSDEILYMEMCEYGDLSYDEYKEQYSNADVELSRILGSLETIFYQWLFGDHVQVTVKFVDGKVVFEVEEYTDHD
jgi:hypothetical protein